MTSAKKSVKRLLCITAFTILTKLYSMDDEKNASSPSSSANDKKSSMSFSWPSLKRTASCSFSSSANNDASSSTDNEATNNPDEASSDDVETETNAKIAWEVCKALANPFNLQTIQKHKDKDGDEWLYFCFRDSELNEFLANPSYKLLLLTLKFCDNSTIDNALFSKLYEYSCSGENLTCIKKLLPHISQPTKNKYKNPLVRAAAGNQPCLLQIRDGWASYNPPSSSNNLQKELEITQLLLDHGFSVQGDPSTYSNSSASFFELESSPFISAISFNRRPVAILLLKHGADVNSLLGDNGCTALDYACANGDYTDVIFLIAQNANVNNTHVKRLNGNTAFMNAANDASIATALLLAGADPSAKNNAGKTAQDITGYRPSLIPEIVRNFFAEPEDTYRCLVKRMIKMRFKTQTLSKQDLLFKAQKQSEHDGRKHKKPVQSEQNIFRKLYQRQLGNLTQKNSRFGESDKPQIMHNPAGIYVAHNKKSRKTDLETL